MDKELLNELLPVGYILACNTTEIESLPGEWALTDIGIKDADGLKVYMRVR